MNLEDLDPQNWTVDQQIKHLNETVFCTLKPSPIHGIGVFAIRDIPKGEWMYCLETNVWYLIPQDRLKEIRPEVLSLILDRWPHLRPPMWERNFRSPNSDQNLMSFMNHSPEPNSQEGKAIRDIKGGEEITEDYDTGNLSDLQKQHYNFL